MKKETSFQNWQLLSAYLDGELPQKQSTNLEKRLSEDQQLRNELESIRQLKIILHNAPRRRVPRNFNLTPDMVKPRTIPFLFPVFSAVSALSMLLFAILLVLQLSPGALIGGKSNEAQSGAQAAIPNYEIMEEGSFEAESLPDESHVDENVQVDAEVKVVESDTDRGVELAENQEMAASEAPQIEIFGAQAAGSEIIEGPAAPVIIDTPLPPPVDDTQESEIPTKKPDITAYTCADDVPSPKMVQSTSTDVLKNSLSLTPTGPQQDQTSEKRFLNLDRQQILLAQFFMVILAMISGWAARHIWKNNHS